MKKTLLILATFLGLIASFSSEATHMAGAYLTYKNVGPNLYLVEYKLIRDCTGINSPTTVQLAYKAPGCHFGGSVNLNSNGFTSNTQYAPGTPTTCNGGGVNALWDYRIYSYSGVVTLPTTCVNWTFSVTINARNTTMNINNGNSKNHYTEALLNNADFPSNNSPAFTGYLVPMLSVNQLHNLSYSIVENDGDSLVYSLNSSLSDFNTPIAYNTGFSMQQPFGPYANPGLSINSSTGVVTVLPTRHVVATSPLLEYQNQYVVGLKIEEYRKNNAGNYIKVGHVINDVFYWVNNINGGINQSPRMRPISINGQSYNPGSVVTVGAGMPVTLQLTAEDPNIQDQLKFISTHSLVLSGATSTVTGPLNNPTFTLNWTPAAADIRDQPYYISVDVVDNSSPINGIRNHTFGFKVRQVTSVKSELIKNSPLISSIVSPGINDFFTVSNELIGAEIQIRNIQGQLIKEDFNYQNNWSADNIASGIYLYQVIPSGTNEIYRGKILISK